MHNLESPKLLPLVRIMFDLETLSLDDNAAIIQIGASIFHWDGELNPHVDRVFSAHISPSEAEANGGHVSKDTMEWWNKQEPQLRTRVFSGTQSTGSVLNSFNNWIRAACELDYTRLRMYCRGPECDWVILKNAFYRTLGEFPLPYRAPQSDRTLDELANIAGFQVPEFKNQFPHDAAHDAITQGARANWILSALQEVR